MFKVLNTIDTIYNKWWVRVAIFNPNPESKKYYEEYYTMDLLFKYFKFANKEEILNMLINELHGELLDNYVFYDNYEDSVKAVQYFESMLLIQQMNG